MKPTAYSHPNFPNVTLWDLPGIGTTKFPADKYLKAVGLEKFDFFIIISADRFRENDAKLAQEIQRMGKRFYFVRSKIDHNMADEKRCLKSKFNEERTLEHIRKNCINGLEELGVESQRVFLVSSCELQLYDFSLLADTLVKQLPAHQRDAMLLALPNVNPGIIREKKNALKSKIKYVAASSAMGAAAPVPGLSIATDVTLLLATAKRYRDIFGLDIKSLQKVADSAGMPLDDLRAVMKSQLATQKLKSDFIIKILSHSSSNAVLMAAEEGSRFIPLIGIPIAMGLSFISTYYTLDTILNMFAEDAQRMSSKALGLNTAV